MYPCTMCGCCCKRVENAAKVFSALGKKELLFPYGWDDTGRCDKLMDNNQCFVYNNRPLMCDVDKLMQYFGLSKSIFYDENIKACNMMMKEDKIDKEFYITLPIQQ